MYLKDVLTSGMTQAVIPTLSSMGVKAISVGVNTMTAPPAVPNPFVWKFNNYSVMATYHKGKLCTCTRTCMYCTCMYFTIMYGTSISICPPHPPYVPNISSMYG